MRAEPALSDLFHEGVSDQYVVAVAEVMAKADWHTFQVLTKRAERLRELLAGKLRFAAKLPHIWWGVSVEDKKYGVPRIEQLRKAPAHTRFLSVEPLLEDVGKLNLTGIDWMIVGGESGAGARPMDQAWVDSMRKQCLRDGVAFFFKQWGGVQKSKAGRELDGRTYDSMPRVTAAAVPAEPERLQRLQEAERLARTFQRAPIPLLRVVPA